MRISNKAIVRPQSVWKFDPTGLQPGDVILERGHSLISKGIRIFDRGRYSHALMWLDTVNFIEAVDMGVRIISYPRFFIINPTDWTILRHPDPNIGRLAAAEARSFSHMKYGTVGAIATKIPGNWKTDPAAMFCSQVIAAAYEKIGAPLVSKPSSKVSPNDLMRNSVLKKVTPRPLVKLELSEGDQKEADEWLDRDHAYTKTNMARELEASQEVYSLVYSLYPNITIAPEYRLSCPPCSFSEALNVIQFLDWETASRISSVMLPALEKRGYFDFITADLQELTERLERQNAAVSAGQCNHAEMTELKDHYSETVGSHIETEHRHRNNADAYDTLWNHRFKLPLFARMARMHRSMELKFSTIIEHERTLIQNCTQRLNSDDSFPD
ncbi:hypothetical protein NKW84_09595 [Acetobacter senegalensis]|uniref:hypothetical protein n=2 Tax=Acetobacteraceae TaxID=433 RepID=UPI0010DB9063|nr:hypothetical protein [Acetobacter senegalensis]MCP1196110.1 hypothetical protein [Acetobacter senegalensis]TCS19653.1 hypothetical protein EDC31_1551 [Acidomonas methanolica]